MKLNLSETASDRIPYPKPDVGRPACLTSAGRQLSGPELYVARVRAAKAFLEARSFYVSRVSTSALARPPMCEAPRDYRPEIPAWQIGGYSGSFANEELIELASGLGFDPEAIA
jgi:hypothetical protein